MSFDLELRPYLKMPASGDGQRIGLFGGSFNPPHEGHLNLCDLAIKRLDLDHIWWMITPGNPLKDTSELPNLMERIKLSNAIISNPKIKVTAFEATHKVRYTADTVRLVRKLRPRQKFVWLMGADNLADFHRWQDWRKIANTLPIAVIDRPGSTLSHRSARAAVAFSRFRVDDEDASILLNMPPPVWTFIHGPRNSLSSSALRARQSVNNG